MAFWFTTKLKCSRVLKANTSLCKWRINLRETKSIVILTWHVLSRNKSKCLVKELNHKKGTFRNFSFWRDKKSWKVLSEILIWSHWGIAPWFQTYSEEVILAGHGDPPVHLWLNLFIIFFLKLLLTVCQINQILLRNWDSFKHKWGYFSNGFSVGQTVFYVSRNVSSLIQP